MSFNPLDAEALIQQVDFARLSLQSYRENTHFSQSVNRLHKQLSRWNKLHTRTIKYVDELEKQKRMVKLIEQQRAISETLSKYIQQMSARSGVLDVLNGVLVVANLFSSINDMSSQVDTENKINDLKSQQANLLKRIEALESQRKSVINAMSLLYRGFLKDRSVMPPYEPIDISPK